MATQYFSCYLKEHLFINDRDTYGENYHTHCLEIYKHYADMAERANARIRFILTLFVPVGTAMIATVAAIPKYSKDSGVLLSSESEFLILLVSLAAGFAISTIALRMLIWERKTQFNMFETIRQIEVILPLAPYDVQQKMEELDPPRSMHREFKDHPQFTKYFEFAIPFIFWFLLIIVVATLYLPALST